jgi:DNA-binding IclR family transcriptional regulator
MYTGIWLDDEESLIYSIVKPGEKLTFEEIALLANMNVARVERIFNQLKSKGLLTSEKVIFRETNAARIKEGTMMTMEEILILQYINKSPGTSFENLLSAFRHSRNYLKTMMEALVTIGLVKEEGGKYTAI